MSEFRMFVVDDEEMIVELIQGVLEAVGPVEAFSSSEACLERLEQCQRDGGLPNLVVLDVGLPGIDGYACCRIIKDMLPDMPVMFVSGHESSEARLDGYDAGGDDFVVKPFSNAELLSKVRVFQRKLAQAESLASQVAMSEQLSSLALASMDESGLVLQLLSKAIACENPEELSEALLHLMRGYRRNGAVQLRCAGTEVNHCADGSSSPLEVSVLDHVRTLGRMFEFKTRSVINFDRVTIMVSDMPVGDPDFCGRIRDNLTIAAQGADARLAAMETSLSERKRFEANRNALERIKVTISELSVADREQRETTARLSGELLDTLTKSYVRLGLTDNQERFLTDLVQGHAADMLSATDQSGRTQELLGELMRDLEAAG